MLDLLSLSLVFLVLAPDFTQCLLLDDSQSFFIVLDSCLSFSFEILDLLAVEVIFLLQQGIGLLIANLPLEVLVRQILVPLLVVFNCLVIGGLKVSRLSLQILNGCLPLLKTCCQLLLSMGQSHDDFLFLVVLRLQNLNLLILDLLLHSRGLRKILVFDVQFTLSLG